MNSCNTTSSIIFSSIVFASFFGLKVELGDKVFCWGMIKLKRLQHFGKLRKHRIINKYLPYPLAKSFQTYCWWKDILHQGTWIMPALIFDWVSDIRQDFKSAFLASCCLRRLTAVLLALRSVSEPPQIEAANQLYVTTLALPVWNQNRSQSCLKPVTPFLQIPVIFIEVLRLELGRN